MNSAELETRLTELEIRLSHQDATIETLNQVVIDQQQGIERLHDEIKQLKQQLQAATAADVLPTEQEPRPPHY